MINHGKVRSTVKPENTSIDEYSVWIANNIEEINLIYSSLVYCNNSYSYSICVGYVKNIC